MSSIQTPRWLNVAPASVIAPTLGVIPAQETRLLNEYIQIPAFSYAGPAGQDASYLCMQFNFSATQNISLENILQPVGVNYLVCYRYRIGTTVYRYKAWNIGFVYNRPSLYTGERLYKNFVIEIWTLPNITQVSSNGFRINTSLKATPTNIYETSDLLFATGVSTGFMATGNTYPFNNSTMAHLSN